MSWKSCFTSLVESWPKNSLMFNPVPLHLLRPAVLFIARSVSQFQNLQFLLLFLAGRRQFARHEWAQKAAYLLGCTLEELSSSIFKHQAKGLQHSASFRGGMDETNHGDNAGRCSWANVEGQSVAVWMLQSQHSQCLFSRKEFCCCVCSFCSQMFYFWIRFGHISHTYNNFLEDKW